MTIVQYENYYENMKMVLIRKISFNMKIQISLLHDCYFPSMFFLV